MKAAVYTGNRRFEVRDIPTPEPEPGQLLVKIILSAICGTDVHAFQYDLARPGSVLGHEFVGTVTQVGSTDSRWAVGDTVVGGGGQPPPGKEPPTRSHPRYNYRTMGFGGGRTRAYAEYIIMEEWEPVALPEGVPEEAAALTEPCAVAVHAIRNSGMKLGDTVGILGAGPIGMLCVQAARAAGAKAVYVSEPATARAETALKLGADAVFNPNDEDMTERMVELTGGVGPDVVFDCAGFKSTLDDAFNTVRRSGRVVLVAVPWEPLPLLPADWMAREIEFKASWGSLPADWQIALDLMRTGKVSTSEMVSGTGFVPLDDIQETFEGLMKPTTQLQVVLKP